MIAGTQPSLRLAAGLTLDRLLRHAASQRGDQIALIDPPNREDFTAGAPRALTYAQADRTVSAIAARLCGLGLVPDHVVALQLPNSVEGVLAFLGILRAGLIASPLPLLWRRTDCAAALAMIDARALVTASRIGTVNHCEIAMHAAADSFMVRHVGMFGGSHDGMVPFDETLNDARDTPPTFVPPERGADAAAPAFPDGLTGQRIAGIAVRRDELQQALKELGHNPLVANAFRKRNTEARHRTTDDGGQATAA